MSPMKEKNPSLENNTDAAARTEKDELLSRLPEELIHRILRFLTTKDAINASFASKSMEAAWLSSCPVLHFNNQQQYLFHVYDQQFLQYVSTTMERVSTHKINLQSFKFETFNSYNSENLDKWIGVALDGRVCEIGVSLDHGDAYFLPARVLTSSSFLKSLHLDGCNLRLLGELGCDDDVIIINLPCLQSLTLIRVRIDNDALQRLLKGCPLLEHLKISTVLLPLKLKIYHLQLKSLYVTDIGTLYKVEVDAPCLEKFSYINADSYSDQRDIIVKSSTSKNLKYLTLNLLTRRSKELWLSKLLPNFTSLETLDLQLCYGDVNSIKISNPHVKNIAITHTNVAQIEIDCPMLLSLRWTARNLVPRYFGRARGVLSSLSAVMIKHHPDFEGHLQILDSSHADLNTAWFHKLRELLSTSRISTMSLLCFTHSIDDVENGDNESLPTSAVKIGQLCLMVRVPESCYSFIMNGFLSACHPDTILLAQHPWKDEKQLMNFIKFIREKLDNWKDEDGCYCSSKIKCWKHQLKSVEIQEFSKFESKERDRYDFGILRPEPPSFTTRKLHFSDSQIVTLHQASLKTRKQ